MTMIRFAEETLPTGETRIHDVHVDHMDKATALVSAMGMVFDRNAGVYFLPLGQRNPGRIETAFIYPSDRDV